MDPWPAVTDDRLLARLAFGDDEFAAFMRALVAALPVHEYRPAMLERALGYPWQRPAGSFILRGGEVAELDALGDAERREVVGQFTRGRHPIVAIGSNGSPVSLRQRFGALTGPGERDVLVLTGKLHDLDVGVIPTIT